MNFVGEFAEFHFTTPVLVHIRFFKKFHELYYSTSRIVECQFLPKMREIYLCAGVHRTLQAP